MPEESIMAQLSIDTVKVEKLVREFLTAQSLTILPQNSFGDAVSQFVDKDDKHAMELFVSESLSSQIKHLLDVDEFDEDELANAMDQQRSRLEELFAAGHLKKNKRRKLKPKPAHWDSDMDGEWADQPGAVVLSDREPEEDEDEESLGSVAPKGPAARGRGRGKAAGTTRATAAASSRKPAASAAKVSATKAGRGKKKVVEEEDDEEDDDVDMLDDEEDEEEEEEEPSVRKATKVAPKKASTSKKAASPAKKAPARAAASTRNVVSWQTQSKLSFSQSQPATQARGKAKAVQEIVSGRSSGARAGQLIHCLRATMRSQMMTKRSSQLNRPLNPELGDSGRCSARPLRIITVHTLRLLIIPLILIFLFCMTYVQKTYHRCVLCSLKYGEYSIYFSRAVS